MNAFHKHAEPIHVYVPSDRDPRAMVEHDAELLREGVIVHRGPALHPDDLTVVGGIPCTSVERTLIDIADDLSPAELREYFRRAVEMGIYDPERFEETLARVEWRGSLMIVREVAAEFR